MVNQSLNGSEFYFSFSLHCFESGHTDEIRPKEAELVRSKQMLNPPPCRGQTSSTSRGSQLRTCRCWPSFWPHRTQLGPAPAHRSQSSEAGGMLHPSTNNKALAWSFISCSGVCVFTLPLNAASCFCADSQESLSYFDSEGSLHLSPWVISWPERLDRHLDSAGEGEGKAGQWIPDHICTGEESCNTTTFLHLPTPRWGSLIHHCGANWGGIEQKLNNVARLQSHHVLFREVKIVDLFDRWTVDEPLVIITELCS